MVNLARFYLQFTVSESCGKCTPCRIGTKRMLEILEKICDGNGTMQDLENLENLANYITQAAVCGLGQTAPNPVLATIKYFKDEYIEHIVNKKCPAKECKKLTRIIINEDKCKGCDICRKACPVSAITGERGMKHTINQNKCIKCQTCITKCPFKAIGQE